MSVRNVAPPRYNLRDHNLVTIRPEDRYGYVATVLAEPCSYRDAVVHQEWQHAMAEELAALERTGTWDLVPSLVSGSIRSRLALMELLNAIRLALWRVVSNKNMVVTMMKLLLLWLT